MALFKTSKAMKHHGYLLVCVCVCVGMHFGGLSSHFICELNIWFESSSTSI